MGKYEGVRTIDKIKLSVNELFSGVGMQRKGIENTGLFDVEVKCTSDIDINAIISYAALHCGLTKEMVDTYSDYPSREEMANNLSVRNIGFDFKTNKPYNWNKLIKSGNKLLNKVWLATKLGENLGDISKIERLPYADLWTVSFPCFTGDTLVLTGNRGYIPIKDITISDTVLSHDNNYHKVIRTMPTGSKEIWKINCMNADFIKCTANHKLYIRARHRVNTRIKGKAVNYRYFDSPIWKECKDLTNDDYLGYAINQNSIIPTWIDNDSNKVKISPLMNNESFWWIIGRYIADGTRRSSKTGNRIIVCCGKQKEHLHLIEKYCDDCGIHYTKAANDRSIINYHICSNELYEFVHQFGYKAHGKYIPSFVIDMPINLCKAFLDGYWSGDGCYTQGLYKATSVSRTLTYGIGQLVAKVYHRPFSIYFTKRNPTTIIEGRIVHQRDTYSISFKKQADIQDKAFYEDGYIWFPINSITNTHIIEPVYDITVDTAHSFTANGNIVHNCTDISVAGQLKGLSEGSNTRSSLLWQQIRLLRDSINRNESPKYIMFENVKSLVSKKFKPDFDKLLDTLSELGYNSYWEVLNAKFCGIPQNRERVFCISIRKDIDTGKMTFPKPFDNGLRLKDMLDDKVDEKFYINNARADKLIEELIENGTLPKACASRGRDTNNNKGGNGNNKSNFVTMM